MLLCIGQAQVSAMDTGRRHCRLFRRDFSPMAFNPYSYGKSHAQEMAQSGISGTIHPLSNRSRYTPGRNYFARTREYDVGRTRTDADAALPQGQNRRRNTRELRQICRRRAPLNPLLDSFHREEKFRRTDFWVTQPTWRRKPKRKRACWESGDYLKTLRVRCCKTRLIW